MQAVACVMVLAGCFHGFNHKGRDRMKIDVQIDSAVTVVGREGGVPVIPMGFPVVLAAAFTSSAGETITIDDPRTSQLTLVHCGEEGAGETEFLLTPSHTDATGETTAPLRRQATLAPGGNVAVTIDLHARILDKCFSPGAYRAAVSYDTFRSAPCAFKVQFTAQSVPRLLEVLNNASMDLWVRKEAFRWLSMLNPSFHYNFNENRVEDFQYWWNNNKDALSIDSIIKSMNKPAR